MKKIIHHIRSADKRKLFVYLFSYATFLILNNLFSNLIFLSLDDYGSINLGGYQSIPCRLSPELYVSLFQGLKLLFFILFLFVLKRGPGKLIHDFFIAYFLYDLIFLLSRVWDTLPLKIKAARTLSSNGQTFFDWYTSPDLSLVISGLWTLALLSVLWKAQKINWVFFLNRLVLIVISVPLVSLLLINIMRLISAE